MDPVSAVHIIMYSFSASSYILRRRINMKIRKRMKMSNTLGPGLGEEQEQEEKKQQRGAKEE